ncbi:shTK domain protein [Ostertagia ostertagi]
MKFGLIDVAISFQMLGLFCTVLAVMLCFAEDRNVTCRKKPPSRCFLGKCPAGYTCLPSGDCCENRQVVLPPTECKDFMEHCDSLQCDHVDFIEFARANCAKTCNYCFENAHIVTRIKKKMKRAVLQDLSSKLTPKHVVRQRAVTRSFYEFSCTDLLEDCNKRMDLCRDRDFIDLMAVFCPRSCMLCTHPTSPGECQELVVSELTCASREGFCTTTKMSEYQKAMGCGKTCGKC